MHHIHPLSNKIIHISLAVSIIILVLSLIIEVKAGNFSAHTYKAHYLAAELYRIPQSILLAGYIAAAIINEQAE